MSDFFCVCTEKHFGTGQDMTRIEPKFGMLLVSLVILVILGAQTLAVIFRSEVWFWPFIDYPMYSTLHREGDRLDKFHPLFATFSDQSEKQVLPEELGFTLFKFEGRLLPAIVCAALHRGVERPPAYQRLKCRPDAEARLKRILEHYEQRNGAIVSLRLEDYRYVLTDKGARKAPTQTLLTLSFAQPSIAEDESSATAQTLRTVKSVQP
jgi:hypothetical protein